MNKKWLVQIEETNFIQTKPLNKIEEIRTKQDLIIAPHQHRRIPLEHPLNDNTYFEQDKSLQDKKKCHAYLIKEEDNKYYINIYNASNFPKSLNTNTVLGYLNQDTNINTVTSNPRIKSPTQTTKRVLKDKDGVAFDISPHLTESEHNQLIKVLHKYVGMFTTKIQDLTPANLPPVSLELIPNAKPVNSPPYKQGKQERQQLNELLDQMKQADILEDCPSFCEWASPAFTTKNKDGSLRLVADMRKVNQVLKPCIYPTPSVNLVLSCLNKAHTFSKLDLKGAFHQLTVKEEFRNLLAIKTQDRLLRYKRLTMGLKVSSALFSKAILALLNKYLYNTVISYIDDVIVFGTSFEKDLQNLDTILGILNKANLKLNTKKCKFMYKQVDILGYTVSQEGVLPQKSSVEAIQNFPTPNCVRRVRQFLGSSSFFRKHIKGYAEITLPLTNLIRESNRGEQFKWSTECQEAFQKIKEILTNPPLLKHFNEDWETLIYVDASIQAIGGCLLQIDPNTNKVHPIAYLSKKFTDTQARYSNAEREMLSLTYAVNYWREFTLGRKITVYTDCNSLVHFKNFKNTSSRLNRLALTLVDYDITVRHKSGTQNLLADSLSRNPGLEELEEHPFDIITNINEVKTENFEELQSTDEYLKEIKLAKITPDAVSKKIRNQARKYEEREGLLYYKHFDGRENRYLLAIPQSKVEEILKTYHDNIYAGGHFSFFKTMKKIKERYYWPNMAQDIEKYTKTCQQCQLRRTPTYKQFDTLTPQIPAEIPFTKLIIDFIGPITQSNGYKYVLMITDSTTRMLFTKPTRAADAKTVANTLLELFCTYGCPRIICHDSAQHFMGNVLKQLLLSLGIEQKASPPYMQRIQGLTERMNLVFKKTLSHYIEDSPNKWSEMVKYVTFAYNTTVNRSIGFSPFYLFYGRNPTFPSEFLYVHKDQDVDMIRQIKYIQRLRKEIPKIIQKAQAMQKKHFDEKKRFIEYEIGDEVLIQYPQDHSKSYSKFQNTYKGPFFITDRINDTTYTVALEKRGKIVNEPVPIARMKPFHR